MANEIIRTNAVRTTFFIRTNVRKQHSISAVMGSYECPRLYLYELLHTSVIIHSYECICTNTSECIGTNILRTSVILPLQHCLCMFAISTVCV